MKKRYEWRELMSDGHLKDVRECGPHYDLDETLRVGSWVSEADAVSAFRAYQDKHGQSAPIELVLVTIWTRDY